MADDNKPLKYMRYAIGEIVLVVIGILIALQINNWNETRKEKIIESKLISQLYDELIVNKEYSEKILNYLDVQYSYIAPIVKLGNDLNIDSLIIKTEENWFIDEFSLITYLLSFTEFYDLDFKYYKAAVSDGSISLIKDNDFILDLEFIYINGPAKVERLYNREVKLNEDLHNYVSEKYGGYFLGNSLLHNVMWDEYMTKKILEKIINDGVVRYKLQQKLSVIKSRQGLIRGSILPNINQAINSHKKE